VIGISISEGHEHDDVKSCMLDSAVLYRTKKAAYNVSYLSCSYSWTPKAKCGKGRIGLLSIAKVGSQITCLS